MSSGAGGSDRPSGSEHAGSEHTGSEHAELALPSSQQSGAEIEQRFVDPGLPAHVHRRGDTDPKAARRAERQVAAMFAISILGTLLFMVGFFAIHLGGDGVTQATWSTIVLGFGLTIALFAIGAAAIHWAKTLMPDDEIVEMRHLQRSTDAERAEAAAILREGGEGAGFGRRKLIWGSMLGAFGAISLVPLVALRDLGPLPGTVLRHTAWKKGSRLVHDPTGEFVRPGDMPIGGVLHVLPPQPEDPTSTDKGPKPIEDLNERAKAAVLLIRLNPADINERSDPRGWSYQGLVAYSKICTHVGCPVGLYEQQTHHLLCPCHQSTFDVLDNCSVIFGPAARPLPQLALGVDADGYLIARGDFTEPVGPSFWERGNDRSNPL